jgi:hypothetical protein
LGTAAAEQGERASTDGNNLLGKFVIEGVERAKAVTSSPSPPSVPHPCTQADTRAPLGMAATGNTRTHQGGHKELRTPQADTRAPAGLQRDLRRDAASHVRLRPAPPLGPAPLPSSTSTAPARACAHAPPARRLPHRPRSRGSMTGVVGGNLGRPEAMP